MNKDARKVRSEALSRRTMGRRRAQISAAEVDSYDEKETVIRTTDTEKNSLTDLAEGADAKNSAGGNHTDTNRLGVGGRRPDASRPVTGGSRTKANRPGVGGRRPDAGRPAVGSNNTKSNRPSAGANPPGVQEVPGPTLDQYFDRWIEYRRATAAKQATPYRYERWYRNHISQPLGGKKIRQLGRRDVIMLQSMMAAEYPPSTVNYTIRVLRLILNDALAEELIEKNPAVGISPMKESDIRRTAEKHRALTREEQRLFMEAAKTSFYYEFFALLLLTGMRHGEAAALTWGDIDRENNVIRITRTLTLDSDGHSAVGAPKSEAGVRDIPMNAAIQEILESQKKKTLAKLGTKKLPGSRRVFYPKPHPDHVLHNATANDVLQRILKSMRAAGQPIGAFSLHALRDTFATRFIEQGGTPQTLKTILGHSSLAITMDLYSHVLPNTKRQEMERLDMQV